jgi:licheninase
MLDLRDWSIYTDPYGSRSGTPRTQQSAQVGGGNLNLIGHYQSPYGYVGGGVSFKSYQTYGRWEVRFRADAGVGYEPVVLLWPQGPHSDGEIDLAEVFPASRSFDGEFLHMGPESRWIGHRNYSVNFTQWHTIAVDWLPTHITYWLDGKVTWTVNRTPGAFNWIPRTPFHLALQMDEGCTNRCRPNSSTPARVIMQVDWVKIYAAP